MITVLTNAHIFDGVGDVLKPGHVVIEGDRIVDVADSVGNVGAEAQVIDLRGRTLMPGLIDAHIHSYTPSLDADRLPMTMVAHYAGKMLASFLDRGFTTVRDVGGADYGLRRAIDVGWIRGPHLIYCGKVLTQTGGHGDPRAPGSHDGCAHHEYVGHSSRVVDGVDSVRRAARDELRNGASFIKIAASGGGLSPSDELGSVQFSEEEIAAAVDEASRFGRYVTVHAHQDVEIGRCLDLGVECIEHGSGISEDLAARIVELGVSVVPTLAIGRAIVREGPKLGFSDFVMAKVATVNARGLETLERLHRSGVRLGFGTDLVGGLDRYQYDEFQIRREVLPPADILRSATSVNAAIVRRPDAGQVAEGFIADLIVVQGNPLEDLSVFSGDGHNVQLVVTGGDIVKNSLN